MAELITGSPLKMGCRLAGTVHGSLKLTPVGLVQVESNCIEVAAPAGSHWRVMPEIFGPAAEVALASDEPR